MEKFIIDENGFFHVDISNAPSSFFSWWDKYYRKGALEKSAAYFGWLAANSDSDGIKWKDDKLIETAQNNQVVEGGRVYTEHYHVCPFCEQDLPENKPLLVSDPPVIKHENNKLNEPEQKTD